MEKQLRIGDLVVATREIREIDPLVDLDVLHARPGDIGVVVGLVSRYFPTVRFYGEGCTITDCAPGEISLLRSHDITVRMLARA